MGGRSPGFCETSGVSFNLAGQPRTNGEAERLNRTLQSEWANFRVWTCEP